METMGQAAETCLRRVARNQAEYARLRLYTWLWAFGVAGVTLALLFTVWLFGVQVRDSGMAPAIEPGDVILFDRLAKYFQSPARGDIVAFSDAAGEGTYAGRIVGLSGETVAVSGGRVYINGSLLDERAYAMGALAEDCPETHIPEGSFFILPDDRSDALTDAPKLMVDASRIKGRALVRVSPLSRIGIF